MSQVPSLEAKGYIRSLYDFSFSSFVTRKVIKVLYILITVVYSIGAVIVFISLLTRHSAADVVIAVIGVPLGYLIYLTIARISLEVLMVIFGIGEDVREMRDLAGRGAGGPGSPAAES